MSVIKDTVLFLQINSKTELFMLCKRKKERRGGVPCKIYVEKNGLCVRRKMAQLLLARSRCIIRFKRSCSAC